MKKLPSLYIVVDSSLLPVFILICCLFSSYKVGYESLLCVYYYYMCILLLCFFHVHFLFLRCDYQCVCFDSFQDERESLYSYVLKWCVCQYLSYY